MSSRASAGPHEPGAYPRAGGGPLGDRVSRRRVYLPGISRFAVAIATCGPAPGTDAGTDEDGLERAPKATRAGARVLPELLASLTARRPPVC